MTREGELLKLAAARILIAAMRKNAQSNSAAPFKFPNQWQRPITRGPDNTDNQPQPAPGAMPGAPVINNPPTKKTK